MAKANVTPLQARHDDVALKEIHITRRCRDLLVRAGLEGKYLTHYIRDRGTTVIYGLTLELAEELLEALGQLRSEAKHYDITVLKALDRELGRVVFAARTKGLLPDPGRDVAYNTIALLQADTPCLARLNVGDRAIDCYIGEVSIVEPYGFYKVTCSKGRFYDEDGERIDYVWGYNVQAVNGKRYVTLPSSLSDSQGRITHLKLIYGGDTAVAITEDIHD